MTEALRMQGIEVGVLKRAAPFVGDCHGGILTDHLVDAHRFTAATGNSSLAGALSAASLL
jgi:hypothetical protein